MTEQEKLIIQSIKEMGFDRTVYRRDLVSAVISKAIHALEQTRWIPVDERLPEEGKAVLVYESECKNIYCAYLDDDTWFIYGSCRSYSVANVIAWMPLPEPYKTESEGD